MRIHRSLRIRSSKGELILKALFDTGASFTVMRKDAAERVGHILPTDVKEVILADGKTKLKVLGYIPISMMLEGSSIDEIAYVIEDLAEELIIGVKVMEFYDIKLDPSTNKIIVGRITAPLSFTHTVNISYMG
ncbi:MAG: retropepsin-like domain-containing protein [Thaumarchaeota archaeon]|nr:retropepsin-like domain-containing protein [Candidatus Geocrenenecus arthurdayi]